MLKIKKILVPVDFSKEADYSLMWALKLAKEQKRSEIHFLYVVAPIPVVPEAGIDVQAVLKGEVDRAKRTLVRWQDKCPRSLRTKTTVKVGDLVQEIKDVCRREKVNLVVMTTHGRHGLSRLFHPNVSEKVVREAPCPVLVFHRKK